MFSSRMFWLIPLAGSVILSGVSCQTAQDVPVPDDQLAATVTPQIKNSYPGWQPTQEAPKGNEEYEALFDAPKTAVPGKEETAPAENTVDEAEKAMYPILYMEVPSVARIDVTEKDEFLLDGSPLPVEIVKKYLVKIAKTHDTQSMVIVHPEAKASVARVNELLDICRDAQIASVTLAVETEKNGKKPAAGPVQSKKTAGKWAVDEAAAAQEYTVKKGDTLSSLSLKFYKRASLWHFIYDANKNTVKDPAKLIVGKKLSIPALKQVESAPAKKAEPAPAKKAEPAKKVEPAPAKKVEAPVEPAPADDNAAGADDMDAAPALSPVNEK